MDRHPASIPLFLVVLGSLWLLCLAPDAMAAGGSEICRDTAKQTGYWRVWPDGNTKFWGTPSVRCFTGGYEEISGSDIRGYECNADFSNCAFKTPYEITSTRKEPDGSTTLYWRNKNRTWSKGSMAYFDGAPQPRPGEKKEEPPSATGRLIDPWEGLPRTPSEMDEYYDADVAHAWLDHYIGTGSGSNACTSGTRFATYGLRYRRDFAVRMDLIHSRIVSPLAAGDPARGGQYDPSVWQALGKKGAVHCYRIEYSDSPPRWNRTDRLHGVIVSPQTAIRYRIENGRVVEMTPLKACCDGEKGVCLGLVPWNESCPQGRSVPGALGSGQFTSCAVCATPEVVEAPAPANDAADAQGSVGCCRNGRCTSSPSSLSCAVSGGLPLDPEGACPASGPDPCAAAAPPPPPPPPAPEPEKRPGACLFNDRPCREVASEEECRSAPGYVMFIEGRSCGIKRGGCCDGVNPCFESTLGECSGEFFEGGCPAKCPEQIGSCTKLCESTNTELCREATRGECARVDGARFAPGERCLAQSDTLTCPVSTCDTCTGVIGGWRTDIGEMYFDVGCRGQLVENPDKPPIPFNYTCNGNRDITVTYGRKKPPLELELRVDGDFRALMKR